MTGSSAAGNSQPVHINMLTSHVTQHGGTRLINRPEGVIMSWEAPANMDLVETSRYMGVNDLRHDVTTDMVTGDTTSVAHAHFTHEEYEAYRNSPQGRVMELPPMPPEKQGNTIGTLTYMPSPSPVRAEYANPPEIPPEDIEDPEAPPGERTSQRLEELKAEREAINQRLINPDAADEYVRFNDLHSSADGLISNIKGTPGTAGDYAAQGSRAILGFVKDAFLGIGELAYEGGKLAVSAQQNMTNPAAMYGQVLDAQILAENVRLGNVTTGTMANGAMNTATSVGNAIIAPVTQPWANGQYVEAVTRGVIEVATLPLVALKSGKVAKGADALTDAATANKVTDAADTAADANRAADAGDAAKAPEPQGPNGNGGKIKQQKKKLQPNTPEHKADRWKRYQEKGGKKSYDEWSKQYDTNMRNYKFGADQEAKYREFLKADEGTVKTAFTDRQIDILKTEEMYAGQLKTGPVSLTKENIIAIKKDANLVENGWKVEHILEKGASKPYLDALKEAGIDVHIGSKLPQ